MPNVDPGTMLLSIAGIAILVGIAVEVVKRALQWDAANTNRLAPLLALILGIVLGILGAVAGVEPATAHNVLAGAITGFLGGAVATHVYDVGSGLAT